MTVQEQIADLYEQIGLLRNEVNGKIKNDAGNLGNSVTSNKAEIDEHSTAIDDIIVAITPTTQLS